MSKLTSLNSNIEIDAFSTLLDQLQSSSFTIWEGRIVVDENQNKYSYDNLLKTFKSIKGQAQDQQHQLENINSKLMKLDENKDSLIKIKNFFHSCLCFFRGNYIDKYRVLKTDQNKHQVKISQKVLDTLQKTDSSQKKDLSLIEKEDALDEFNFDDDETGTEEKNEDLGGGNLLHSDLQQDEQPESNLPTENFDDQMFLEEVQRAPDIECLVGRDKTEEKETIRAKPDISSIKKRKIAKQEKSESSKWSLLAGVITGVALIALASSFRHLYFSQSTVYHFNDVCELSGNGYNWIEENQRHTFCHLFKESESHAFLESINQVIQEFQNKILNQKEELDSRNFKIENYQRELEGKSLGFRDPAIQKTLKEWLEECKGNCDKQGGILILAGELAKDPKSDMTSLEFVEKSILQLHQEASPLVQKEALTALFSLYNNKNYKINDKLQLKNLFTDFKSIKKENLEHLKMLIAQSEALNNESVKEFIFALNQQNDLTIEHADFFDSLLLFLAKKGDIESSLIASRSFFKNSHSYSRGIKTLQNLVNHCQLTDDKKIDIKKIIESEVDKKSGLYLKEFVSIAEKLNNKIVISKETIYKYVMDYSADACRNLFDLLCVRSLKENFNDLEYFSELLFQKNSNGWILSSISEDDKTKHKLALTIYQSLLNLESNSNNQDLLQQQNLVIKIENDVINLLKKREYFPEIIDLSLRFFKYSPSPTFLRELTHLASSSSLEKWTKTYPEMAGDKAVQAYLQLVSSLIEKGYSINQDALHSILLLPASNIQVVNLLLKISTQYAKNNVRDFPLQFFEYIRKSPMNNRRKENIFKEFLKKCPENQKKYFSNELNENFGFKTQVTP